MRCRPQQQQNVLDVAKLLLAQNQVASNLIPVLAQILATAGAPVAPSVAPHPMNNDFSSAALLPLLASILGAATVTPQNQTVTNATHLTATPGLHQTSQHPPASISLPQLPNVPTYANISSGISHPVPPPYLQKEGSTMPFVNQLKNVYDMHMSSLGQPSAPLSTHSLQNNQQRRSNEPLVIASKPPASRESFSSLPVLKSTSSSVQEGSLRQASTNGTDTQTDGSILVGLLSSLKESYLKALNTPDGERADTGPINATEEPPRVSTVTDTSSVSQHGSSTEEVDWNPDRRQDAHMVEKRAIGSSSKGPPRKRHKQKQQARRD